MKPVDAAGSRGCNLEDFQEMKRPKPVIDRPEIRKGKALSSRLELHSILSMKTT